MSNRCLMFTIVMLALICSVTVSAQYNCIALANPPKLPVLRGTGRFSASGAPLRVRQTAGLADSWKPTRHEIGSVSAGTMVEVLEDLIVVDAPDIVRVTEAMEGLKVKEGDTMLRFARIGEGWADLWANGCWYKSVDAAFITEPDGGGCGGSACSAKVTKTGSQMWWFRIRLPNGRIGWTLSQALDLTGGG